MKLFRDIMGFLYRFRHHGSPPPAVPVISPEHAREREEFFRDDSERRHALARQIQADQFEIDMARIRVNELKAEQNARYGVYLGDGPPAGDRDSRPPGDVGA